jgi:protein SCO1/2
LTGALWGLTVLAMMAVIGAGLLKRQRGRDQAGAGLYIEPASANADPDVLGKVPEFALTDQDKKPFGSHELKGSGPCPIMTNRLADLQKTITDSRVRFLTISVDPETDTPEVLKKYAGEHGADEARWRFLTGDKTAIFTLARGMLISALPAQGEQPIMHSEKYILVDGEGQIRGQYNSKDGDEINRLVADARRIAAGGAAR